MRTRFLALSVLMSSTFAGILAAASACTCDVPGLVAAREFSDAAFTAEIVSLVDIPTAPWGEPSYLAVAQVIECWKGGLAVGQRVQVWTASCIGCCGDYLVVGQPRMLFVRGTNSLLFRTWLCSGNTTLGPHIAAALGEPGCTVAVSRSAWSMVKRLYAEP